MAIIIIWIVTGLILGISVDTFIPKDDPILIRVCCVLICVLFLPFIIIAALVCGPIILLIKTVDYIISKK